MPKVNSNFQPVIKDECVGCGICVEKCPVDAITMVDKKAVVDVDICFGCGVCSRFCSSNAIEMERREVTRFVPKDAMERIVMNAIERGKLQNYLFNNQDLWTHDFMRKFLKIIFTLPPTKWALVNDQLRSKFLNSYAKRMYKKKPEMFNFKEPDYSHPEMRS